MQTPTLTVNEIFYSLQGEGARAGSANTFIRLSGCNLTCSRMVEGFDCDTEFTSGRKATAEQIIKEIESLTRCRNLIWTGGEPGLQLTDEIVEIFAAAGFWQAVETNGTRELPRKLDWVSMSPKTAEHTLKGHDNLRELRYVRREGMAIPRPMLKSEYKFISPACDPSEGFKRKDVDWCIGLIRENPDWRLSMQNHKLWSVR